MSTFDLWLFQKRVVHSKFEIYGFFALRYVRHFHLGHSKYHYLVLEITEGAINNGQSRRNWQHLEHKMQEEDKQKHQQHRKLKTGAIRIQPKTGENPGAREEKVVTASYNTPIGHHNTQTNTNNVNKTTVIKYSFRIDSNELLQLNIEFVRFYI